MNQQEKEAIAIMMGLACLLGPDDKDEWFDWCVRHYCELQDSRSRQDRIRMNTWWGMRYIDEKPDEDLPGYVEYKLRTVR